MGTYAADETMWEQGQSVCSSKMDVAIADFIHSHLLLFSITSDAKLLKIKEIAKQLG